MKLFGQSLRATILLMFVCGVLYPAAVTAMANMLFPHQSQGSLVKASNGQILGSEIIAQGFKGSQYFHPRASAAMSPDGSASQPYDGAFSSASNLGPDNAQEIKAITDAATAYRLENHLPANAPVPIDAVTASGSGLDPDISLANAFLQAPRIAETRHLKIDALRALIEKIKTGPQIGFLGTDHVNVLKLNLALDKKG
ncbi:MAG: potassium-transporting ATPase subunit KdpC [Leptospirales bacterium]